MFKIIPWEHSSKKFICTFHAHCAMHAWSGHWPNIWFQPYEIYVVGISWLVNILKDLRQFLEKKILFIQESSLCLFAVYRGVLSKLRTNLLIFTKHYIIKTAVERLYKVTNLLLFHSCPWKNQYSMNSSCTLCFSSLGIFLPSDWEVIFLPLWLLCFYSLYSMCTF